MQKNAALRAMLLLFAAVTVMAAPACDEIVNLIRPSANQQKKGGPPAKSPSVSVVTVAMQKITLTTELPGRTVPFRIAEIRPQISGLILKRLFTEGSFVEAGQELYRIDPAPFQAALDNAKAALGRSEASRTAASLRAERYKALLADRAVSQQNYDDAVAALEQVQADIQYWKAMVKSARINLAYTRITAPISGRIGRSAVTDGAIVTAYQPVALATIQQLDPIYVDVPQSTTEQLRLRESNIHQGGSEQNKVSLLLENGTAYPQEGALQFSDVTVDPTTGSVILRVVFPNPDKVLLPGMFVRAVIREGVDEQAILVPQQGVSRDSRGNPFALVVNDESKVSFRPLSLERTLGDKWLISSGLTPGDRLIVEGLLMLRPGTVVEATPFNPAPAGQKPTQGPGATPANQKEGEA